MADAGSVTPSPSRPRKRRIPTSCGSCRESKVKCDGRRPCSRCRKLRKVCTFEERPKEAHELKIEQLENQIEQLKEQLDHATATASGQELADTSGSHAVDSVPIAASQLGNLTASGTANLVGRSPASTRVSVSLKSGNRSSIYSPEEFVVPTSTRTTFPFSLDVASAPDVVESGLVTIDQAYSFYTTFFQGCDRYVPVFDPHFDSMDSVRIRSSILFSAICTVGCRALSGTESHPWRPLNLHLRRILNAAISTPALKSLETIQALLVRACYASERSLLLAAAFRMALDLRLPEAYDDLMTRTVSRDWGSGADDPTEGDSTLMRKTRTWMHILNMSHIMHVDAGDFLSVRFNGDARRCRALLQNPIRSKQDMCLWPQVELNVLRARMYASLSEASQADSEIMGIVSDAVVDINVWYDDWKRILDVTDPHTPWLVLNMQVQRCWGITMALCRAIRISGVENVDLMSPTQRKMLSMAQDALWQHLSIITQEPRLYLQNLRYAMDFVWAKCVFCYMLLLKLSILLPSTDESHSNSLIDRGNVLLRELSEAGGGLLNGHRSNTGKVYLQLLQTGIEKYTTTMDGNFGNANAVTTSNTVDAALQSPTALSSTAAQESFVPEQFVFEWDFPGLTLFSSSATQTSWLDDILLEALNGTDEFMGFGWLNGESNE